MGYSTYFDGSFNLSRKLTVSELDTLQTLNAWDKDNPEDAPDGPCDWVVDEDKEGNPYLRHNYEEKFRDWDEWTHYLAKLFSSWGVQMNGRMAWQGEDTGDMGMIFVKDNQIRMVSISELAEFMEDNCDDLYEGDDA